jgi:CDP-diacylglycerol--glycerol-3-phosphate 3-phosphatidyltransferase
MGESADQRDNLIEAWSALHRGLRPSPLVRRWLTLMWTLARPLAAARVPPAAITAAGVLFAVDAPLFAARLPLVALVLVLAAALCDGLDGAVALLQGRATRSGAVADIVADRIADTAFALVIWQAGAPLWLVLLAAASSIGLEFARRRPLITVAERPTRVICTTLACASAAISDAAWPPTVCAAVWVAATLVAFVQMTS